MEMNFSMSELDNLLNPNLVKLNIDPPKNFNSLLCLIADYLASEGMLVDRSKYIADVLVREAEGSTYMGRGIGIPHAKTSGVKQAAICMLRFKIPMVYESNGDSGPVDKIFAISVPENAGRQHLEILASLARLLVDDDVLYQLSDAKTSEEYLSIINKKL